MESFLSLFIFHDSYVVSSLVLGITVIVVLLLLFNHKSPESVVKTEMGSTDSVEGALRRVLGEQRWNKASDSAESGELAKLADLEKEVLVKDKAIAELNKQLTQSSGSSGGESQGLSNDNSELIKKISDLESRLQEYEIIEDDIADLSLYRTENEKLKVELKKLKGQLGSNQGQKAFEEEPLQEQNVRVEEAKDTAKTQVISDAKKEKKVVDGTDLVAEFEKVVNNQDQLNESNDRVVAEKVSEGKVVMADKKPSTSGEIKMDLHPKLKNISPDSKEEAEVFIADLKSLKKAKE